MKDIVKGSKLFKSALSMGILTVMCAQGHAAALDRSGQPITAFLQDGNYAEASISVLDADVSGTARPNYVAANTDPATGNMANNYQFYNAALKLQLTRQFSFGLIYDQPFGADVTYDRLANSTYSSAAGATTAEVSTQNLSFLFGYQPTENWNIYAGPVYQTIKGDLAINGLGFSEASGYGYDVKEDSAVGWLAGVAYQIPEIALKAALTYRAEIKHEFNAVESFSLPLSALVPLAGTGQTELTTPQSVNFDFQTGLNPSTLAFFNARWVNWKDFYIKPYQFGKVTEILTTMKLNTPISLNLVDYDKDQISINAGLAKKLNEQWSVMALAGWDSGAGNPTSTLGPIDGYWTAGLGAQFNPAPNYFIQGAFKYLWFGDATGHAATYAIPGNAEAAKVADYSDNTAWGYMLKFGYKF